MNSIAILIPSYKPEDSLIQLIGDLRQLLPLNKIIIVRDGIFSEQDGIIQKITSFPNVIVLSHAVNLGKGRALKTGFNEILVNHPKIEGVVTADADGQHLPADIVKVVKGMENNKTLVLGSRFKSMEDTPLKSKIGNTTTRLIFKSLIGMNLKDTQTGLRGIPKKLLHEMMNISGEKYEYETNMLISAKQHLWSVKEIDIQTVYINQNRGSHFNPILDSMRIYFLIFRFFFSSIATSVIDFLVFSFLNTCGVQLSVSIGGARLVAGLFNFTVNKKIVFKSSSNVGSSALKYWILVALMASLSFLGTRSLTELGFNVYFSKLLIEASLFIFSFIAQRDIIFRKKDSHEND